MTDQNQALFYDVFIMICAFMALVNLGRIKKRGASGVLLGAAFLVLGLTVFAYSSQWPTPVAIAGGTVVFALLVADLVYKARRNQP